MVTPSTCAQGIKPTAEKTSSSATTTWATEWETCANSPTPKPMSIVKPYYLAIEVDGVDIGVHETAAYEDENPACGVRRHVVLVCRGNGTVEDDSEDH
ncbi:hypothetical protein OCU04_009252 [Sclerotinia nivalis]|uniref:Uncharacterized protein n=1 Tax=Sclerotinia nivalis TaxID=352851 RepID=A0A9X0AEM1_9HELO|nr:hypothetical protein OCU04_009252 [Sclerotinia nivalis]